MTTEIILARITVQLQQWGVGYRDVVVGPTDDAAETRRKHVIVGKDMARFITFPALNEEDAGAVTSELMRRGCDGPAEGSQKGGKLVYVFVKSPTTLPSR